MYIKMVEPRLIPYMPNYVNDREYRCLDHHLTLKTPRSITKLRISRRESLRETPIKLKTSSKAWMLRYNERRDADLIPDVVDT